MKSRRIRPRAITTVVVTVAAKHQEHDDGLDEDGLERGSVGEDEPGHGPGQED